MINYSLNSQNYLTLKIDCKKSFNFKNRGFPHEYMKILFKNID